MAAQSCYPDRQHNIPDLQKLRDAVETMDCLAGSAMEEIASIAKLALSHLETPEGYRHVDDIANALTAIWGKADENRNCIKCEAERVGCNYVDDARRRRWDAGRAHREALGA
jgi:hypothetical protein